MEIGYVIVFSVKKTLLCIEDMSYNDCFVFNWVVLIFPEYTFSIYLLVSN